MKLFKELLLISWVTYDSLILARAHQEGILFKNSENIELKPRFNL